MGDRFQHLLDSLAEQVVVVDRDLRITHANPAWLRRTGSPLSEILGQPCHQAFQGVDSACDLDLCPVQECFDSGQPSQKVCTGQQQLASGQVSAMSSSPVLDSAGQVTEVIHVLHTAAIDFAYFFSSCSIHTIVILSIDSCCKMMRILADDGSHILYVYIIYTLF